MGRHNCVNIFFLLPFPHYLFYLPQFERERFDPRLREFSDLPRLVARDTTRRLEGRLSVGLLFLWSTSFPSPLCARPAFTAERLALFLAERSAIAFGELWNFWYSCSIPALVRFRFPELSVYQYFPIAIAS